MMSFEMGEWRRVEFDSAPVYVRADPPCWFVPNAAGDELLKGLQGAPKSAVPAAGERFLQRLPDASVHSYPGRQALLELESLQELWLHVTDRCNLSCSHCLFASSPAKKRDLDTGFILTQAASAASLGCRVFALTGGEPTLHPDFPVIVDTLLQVPCSHVVLLSNGVQLSDRLARLRGEPERLHLQISVDGLRERHDAIRGRGAFGALEKELGKLQRLGYAFTLSMCPTRRNVKDMAPLIDFAAGVGAAQVHYMWYFVRGRGRPEQFVAADELLDHMVAAALRAERAGVGIDNLESLKAQVFAPMGTIHDGSTMGWESVAIGPDRRLYPSAALVGIETLATDLDQGLEAAWRRSRVLEEIRNQSAVGLSSPTRLLLGGGDPDHSFSHAGTWMGNDPYQQLHEHLMFWLIAREAEAGPDDGPPRLRLKMGDILESCGAHGSVALTHSNCLLAVATGKDRAVVKEFYAEAAQVQNTDIINPIHYSTEQVEHIPEEFRFRGYGCGSPVTDAGIEGGERVLDLGCGSGIECFIASRLVGSRGQVIGLDMLEPMLGAARRGADAVSGRLGYHNLRFLKGYLESLPLQTASVDVALSNCVLNLSTHKRRTFAEILRVLKPGGRLVASDVVCDLEPDAAIRNDEALRGQCIAGAQTQKDLVALLEETGYRAVRLLKRFPYRVVRGHPFFSLSFEARKAAGQEPARVIYRGPFSQVATAWGRTLTAGALCELSRSEAEALGDQVFLLDADGAVLNQEGESACNCGIAPGAAGTDGHLLGKAVVAPAPSGQTLSLKRRMGCMVCGAPLRYQDSEENLRCSYCGQILASHTACEKGHFVCDGCHGEDALKVIENMALGTKETDMVKLLEVIRRHPAIPIHGPEHHAMVPVIILATYRNLGGRVSDKDLRAALRRGAAIAGGACGFMGCCGAAIGVGIAYSILLQSNPVKGLERRQVQSITQQVLAEISQLEAARCCQRDSWIALTAAAELSRGLLPLALQAEYPLRCRQQAKNRECLKDACPLHPTTVQSRTAEESA